MVIVCNGVYKSGSTWIYSMLIELLQQKDVPDAWAMKDQPLNIGLLKPQNEEIFKYGKSRHIVSKVHLYQSEVLDYLKAKGCKFIVTSRPIHEILISHYHHFSNTQFKLPFGLYLPTVGVFKAFECCAYEKSVDVEDYCDVQIDFRELKKNPVAVLKLVVDTLELEFTDDEMLKASANADLNNKSYSELFGEKKQRDWFTSRSKNDGFLKVNSARLVGFLVTTVCSIPLIYKFVCYLLFLFRGRRARAVPTAE